MAQTSRWAVRLTSVVHTLGGTALERGIHQFTEVIGNGRRHTTGLPALYLAGLITSHPGCKVTDGLDKEIAVS